MKHAAVRALLVLAAVAIASAACTPCANCRSPQCWRDCSAVCTTATPDTLVVKKGTQCVNAGAKYGADAAKLACQYVMEACDSKKLGAANVGDAVGKLSLSQCSKVTQGACAQAAGDAAPDACQQAAVNGFLDCTAQRFKDMFHERAAAVCMDYAIKVTKVDPTTGAWAQPGGRRLLF